MYSISRALNLGVIWLFSLALLTSCTPGQKADKPPLPAAPLEEATQTESSEIRETQPVILRTAIYAGAGGWDESITAAENLFAWMGVPVERVDQNTINADALEGYDILLIPGGDMYQYDQDISSRGDENIREFVQSGGCYVGICGGAYFASQEVIWRGETLPMSPLGLFSGTAQGPIHEIVSFPDYGMSTVEIVTPNHPVTESSPKMMQMLYYWGPILSPNENAAITILGKYQVVDEVMMMAFDYGFGRVFLVGTHPEIEEDSNRDVVNFADELDDQESDWDMMKQAAFWCAGE